MNRLTNVVLMVIVFLGLTLGMVDSVHANISSAERAALIALYESTDGDHWTNKSGWKDGDLAPDGFALPGTEEDWYGIACSGNYVGIINLMNNGLSGSIPPELENLTILYYLYLNGNQLTGSIPLELGNLVNLSYLDLSVNQLTGSIPLELSKLVTLRFLYLNGNQLTGSIPPELGNLVDLNALQLGSNQLTGGIPPELGKLTNLYTLSLYNIQLTGAIPEELMNLIALVPGHLDICNNHLYTNDAALRAFLDNLQPGWESCQTPLPLCLPGMYLQLLGN